MVMFNYMCVQSFMITHITIHGCQKIYVAGAKIAAPKLLLVPHSPVRLVTLARKARGKQSPFTHVLSS